MFLYVAEKILAYRNRNWVIVYSDVYHNTGYLRSIRLRELTPELNIQVPITDTYLSHTSGLNKKSAKIRVDKNGFIVPSRIHNNPDRTIVFLGGSTTECLFVEEESRFPFLVGRYLELDLGKSINSFNGGVSGNNSLDTINTLLNKVIPLKPDIVVAMENVNDRSILLYEGSYWNNNPFHSPIIYNDRVHDFFRVAKEIKDWLFPNLFNALKETVKLDFVGTLKRLLRGESATPGTNRQNEFVGSQGAQRSYDEKQWINEFEMNLQTFIDISKARRITPVLMTMANRLTATPDPVIKEAAKYEEETFGITYRQLKKSTDDFNEAVRRVGKRNGILVIDLARKVPQDVRYMYDAGHYNDEGSKFVARIIADELEPLLSRQN